MENIKIKEKNNKSIKIIDKSVNGLRNTKDNLVQVKNSTNNISTKEESVNNSTTEKLETSSNFIKNKTITGTNNIRKKSISTTKNNIIKLKNNNKVVTKANKVGIKNSKRAIKTSNKGVKNKVKVTKQSMNTGKKTSYAIKQLTKKSYTIIKNTIIGTAKTIKLALASTKALVAALIAGGSMAVMIIIIICLIGLLCSSIFGIFFSGQKTSTYDKTVSDVISIINIELSQKISDIKTENPHDDYVLEVERASWEDVLSIYIAKTTNGVGTTEVMTMDSKKEESLKEVFWDMNDIEYRLETKEISQEFISDDGVSTFDNVTKNILYITVSSKSIDEMMKLYNFNTLQKNEVSELAKDEYKNLWGPVIYGYALSDSSIVEIAITQLGNVGGEPYWSWYGFDQRVEWCATFVSWLANEIGYIENNIIPKFASVANGINWFKMMGQWEDSVYIPNTGNIIFFDWEQDGKSDHVGIVEKVENNKVYTIEGNSGNEVKRLQYDINSKAIFGYGIPLY